jgi:hypothetical protein
MEVILGTSTPVIKIAGNDHRFIAWHVLVNALGERLQLLATLLL